MRASKKPNALPPPTEDDTQKVIVDGLRAYGYLVQITSRRPRKCWKCFAWPKSGRGDGVSRGVADLLVRKPSWARGLWIQLEVKRPGRFEWSSPEQKMFAEAGDIVVVQCLEAALGALRSGE